MYGSIEGFSFLLAVFGRKEKEREKKKKKSISSVLLIRRKGQENGLLVGLPLKLLFSLLFLLIFPLNLGGDKLVSHGRDKSLPFPFP